MIPGQMQLMSLGFTVALTAGIAKSNDSLKVSSRVGLITLKESFKEGYCGADSTCQFPNVTAISTAETVRKPEVTLTVWYRTRTLTVEEVYKDRDQFAALVREVAAPDVGRMGIEILSFTIKDIYDDVQYLSSLGKAQTAIVKRDADIGVAEANRDAGIREAECEKSAMDVKYTTDAKVENASRMYKLQRAQFDTEVGTAYLSSLGKAQTAIVKRDADIGVAEANRDAGIREAECEKSAMDVKYTTDAKVENASRMYKLQRAQFDTEVGTAKAESQLAYELQAAKIRQKIRNEEILIDIVERKKMIEIEEQEMKRKDKELTGTVKLPAEAESYKVEMLAQGRSLLVFGLGNSVNLSAYDSPTPTSAPLTNSTETQLSCLWSWRHYPSYFFVGIAAEVAAPLAKTDEIVLIGGEDRITAEVNRLVGTLPPAVQALTGVDVSKTVETAIADSERIKKVGGAEAGAIEAVGKADAERMRMKAAAYKQYGDAAIMSLVLEALPKIAAEVAAPLAKTEEIVLIGGEDRITAEVNRLVGTIPPAVQALTGVDISKVIGRIPGASSSS
ncbi:unnamed protein product [Cyprideis torosa]|uniref:Band 7 domain-containing protein n=1 Tax=Cyprideis torosa TaxID=163714 RepID=A0A7R8W8B7_9CRUS|nr:unnamed protein product [Cyprideis torosa]CAG0884144.1 unnamed protein product [Cyprideis torosa]